MDLRLWCPPEVTHKHGTANEHEPATATGPAAAERVGLGRRFAQTTKIDTPCASALSVALAARKAKGRSACC